MMQQMEISFDDHYRKFRPIIASIAREKSRSSRVPFEDFVSRMGQALWEAYNTFDPTKSCALDTWSARKIRQAAGQEIQSANGTHHRRVYATLDKPADEDTPISEPADAETTEAAVFNRPNARRAHQLELIRSLVDKTDLPTISLVDAYLADANLDAKPTQIAKSVGLHHNVADKRLIKLSRKLNANQVAELIDLMPVGKRVRPEFLSA
jgi:DNA-directed RNA polymerase specialized sigma subunit